VKYFAWELIGERGRADLPMVVICNIPYTIVPLILGYRLRRPVTFPRSEGDDDDDSDYARPGEAARDASMP
jgi:hypothetical protein